ncbi:uroporphyrinogen-III C-methyltransferase [Fusobacterium sp. MFO224]|uniref:uroporphyrinogen-III C-methyltransferase n=1 Tax=Fusobacterium sp. MFO224 TaxID=3378070 RepID=UPI003854EA2C
MENKGKVYILGGGSGDFELLTLKGKRYLEEADCVIYDRLVNDIILQFINPKAEKIYLGKKNTEGGLIQEKINKTLVEKALSGKNVVRLKGGDPFVFGRGGEEIEELIKNEVKFEIVPGITSAISVPEYAGIPVTHRGIAKSFHVFTGMTAKNNTYHNFENMAKLEGTLIFLMGVKNLGLISKKLIENGKNSKTPVAIVENGTTGQQRVTEGCLENIEAIAKKNDIKPPAVIIIGKVVNKRRKYRWFEDKPLYGKTILVTREKRLGEEFCRKIETKGGKAILLPMIKLESNMENFLYKDLKKYKALMFNSPNGVKFFFDSLDDMRKLGNIKIGVVGDRTREELEKYKIKADIMPENYLGMELAREMTKITKKGEKILIITSDVSPLKEKELKSQFNREFEILYAYKNRPLKVEKSNLLEKISQTDYITFFSSSAVENFIKCLKNDVFSLKNTKIVSIGPSTTKKIKNIWEGDIMQPSIYKGDEMIKTICKD